MWWREIIPSGPMAVDDLVNRIAFLLSEGVKMAFPVMAADGIAV